MIQASPQALLRRMFDAAIDAAQPARCVPPHLPAKPRGRVLVAPARRDRRADAVGAGKASAAWLRRSWIIMTGPTLTNVNDFRAILITGEARSATAR